MIKWTPKVNTSFSAPGPVGLGQRIGNRVEIPSGTATVSVEALPKSESGSLDAFREDRGRLRMRKPGYLLNLGFRRGLQVRAVRRLLAQKYGCGSFCGCRSLFAFPVL